MTIRPGRAADAADVLSINAAAAPGVTHLDRDELDVLAASVTHYLVAEVDGAVVAYLLAVAGDVNFDTDEFRWFRSRYDGAFLYVDQIAVADAHRSRGIGARLYEKVEAWAREHAIARVTCEVNLFPPNPGSARFHDRLGYTEVDKLVVSDGRVVSLRAKELPGA